MVENSEIVIYNSSFWSLDLKPGTKAQIIDCYIDAHLTLRPTLITANSSVLSIQNCRFSQFVNKTDSTVLHGHNSNKVIVEDSAFIQHRSLKGVLFLQINSSMHIDNSLISQNMALALGYSPITLQDQIQAVIHNTVFSNNSALLGAAMIVKNQCQVTITNCTFSANKANKFVDNEGGAIFVNNSILKLSQCLFIENEASFGGALMLVGSHSDISACSFENNEAQIAGGALVAIEGVTMDMRDTSFVRNKAPYGGALNIQQQTHILATNCTFKDNSAQNFAGAVFMKLNVTFSVQQSAFLDNAADRGGAFDIEGQSYVLVKNCRFENNSAHRIGGCIFAAWTVTLDMLGTICVGNQAGDNGGAIAIQLQTSLFAKNCTFDHNLSGHLSGAISANSASHQGGAIAVQNQSHLFTTNCRFEHNSAVGMAGAIMGAFNAKLEIHETDFTGNKASTSGGALSLLSLSEVNSTWCVFHRNIAKIKGGAVFISESLSEIENTNFTENNGSEGGAICIEDASKFQTKMCSYRGNIAEQIGGALDLEHVSKATIEDCHFLSNKAVRDSGGAISLISSGPISMSGTLLLNNWASVEGGAVAIIEGFNVIINNITCVGNRATSGGCLYAGFALLTLNKCYINGNSGSGGGITAWSSRIQVGPRFHIPSMSTSLYKSL